MPDTIQEFSTMRVQISPHTVITGGIVCSDLQVAHLNFQVAGPVNALRSAVIEASDDGVAEFGGGLIAGESLTIRLASGSGLVRIIGDVAANVVHLDNTVIYGNLLCNSAQVEDSVIFGAIACRERLAMARSVCSTFHGESVGFGSDNYILGMGGSAVNGINVSSPIRCLAIVPLEDMLQDGLPQLENVIELTQQDVHETLVDGEQYFAIHCYDRVMDIGNNTAIQANADLIKSAIVERGPSGLAIGDSRLIESGKLEPLLLELLKSSGQAGMPH